MTVSWSPSTPGTYPIIGYDVDLTWTNEGGQSGGGAPFCHTPATVYTCTAPAQPGVTHDLVIAAADSSSYGLGEPAFATSGIVPASRTVPKSTGDLTLPAGKTSTVPAGEKMTVSGTGYSPVSTVTVLIYSEPRVLATVRTDGSGSFSVEVTVPEGLPAGQHTLVAAGIDPMGAMRYLTLPVTVSGTGTPTLAYTGADVTLPAIGGSLAVLVGGGLLLVARRRPGH
jgi:titin